MLRHSQLDQAIGDPLFGAVVLHPNLPIANIQMQDTPVNALVLVPPHRHQLIMRLLKSCRERS